MQKLLIHIKILLVFIVLFCSHSAFGQSGSLYEEGVPTVHIDESSAGMGADDRAIDLGERFTVYWAERNVGASGPTNHGTYFQWRSTQNWSDSNWKNWRLPSESDMDSLLHNTSMSNRSKGKPLILNSKEPGNPNSITIPVSGYMAGGVGPLNITTETDECFLWTTDKIATYGYALKTNGNSVSIICKTISSTVNGMPFRPVIDKVELTVTTAGGNTITKTYPKGTTVRLSAYKDSCHMTHHWETNTNAPNINEATPVVTITSDITYTAFFERITYNASVRSNDEDMGKAQIVSTAEPDGKYKCGSIEMTATPHDDCHELIYWKNGSGEKFYPNTNDEDYKCTTDEAGVNTLEVPFHGDNTFTAIFSIKTTTVVATTEDDQKGWVGLNVWNR